MKNVKVIVAVGSSCMDYLFTHVDDDAAERLLSVVDPSRPVVLTSGDGSKVSFQPQCWASATVIVTPMYAARGAGD